MPLPPPRRSPRRLPLALVPLVPVLTAWPWLPALAQGPAGNGPDAPWMTMAIALGSVLLAASAALVYLWLLQQRFLAACREAGEIAVFALQPAGVPSGTVRSLIALLVIFASIGFAAFSLIQGKPFPEVMSAVLGTVLGFYFGSRTAHGSEAHEVMERTDAAGRLRGRVLDRLRDGMAAGERLRGEGGAPAAPPAGERVGGLVRLALARAARSFAAAGGAGCPPHDLARAIAAIATRLAGTAYERWIARILHAPWNPRLLAPLPIEPEAAVELVRCSPILARAFAAELATGDRLFLIRLVARALAAEGLDELWAEGRARFADRAELETGLAELRRAALEQELVRDVDRSEVAGIGPVAHLLAAIDRLHEDPAARGDLDALVLIADQLKRGGIAPAVVFEAALAGMKARS
jgi:hypothetical protein